VQMVFCTIPSAIQYVKAGTLRAIAVTSATRLESMPEIPTVGETVPGFESAQWYGVGAPTGTPAAIIAALNEEVRAALADSKIKARIEDLGGIPLSMSPEEFGKFQANDRKDGQGDQGCCRYQREIKSGATARARSLKFKTK